MARKQLIRRITMLLCLIVFMLGVPVESVQATTQSTVKAEKLQSGLQFTLTGLPYNGSMSPIQKDKGKELKTSAVQNFVFSPDNRYIFVTQQGTVGSKVHTILSWCTVPEERNKDALAMYEGSVILDGYGHGETIAITQPNKAKQIYNLWVSCTPTSAGVGTEIARVTLKISDSGKGKVQKTVKLTNFSAAIDDIPGVAVDRAGVAVNEADNRIAFRIHTVGKGTYYEIYDLKKVNAKLNTVKNNKKYDVKKLINMRKAHVESGLVPFDSFQSFDIDGKYIYVCGGNFNKGAGIYRTKYKNAAARQSLGNMSSVTQSITLQLKLTIKDNHNQTMKTLDKSGLEVEGMKIQLNGNKMNYYVNFVQTDLKVYDTIGIYKFTK